MKSLFNDLIIIYFQIDFNFFMHIFARLTRTFGNY